MFGFKSHVEKAGGSTLFCSKLPQISKNISHRQNLIFKWKPYLNQRHFRIYCSSWNCTSSPYGKKRSRDIPGVWRPKSELPSFDQFKTVLWGNNIRNLWYCALPEIGIYTLWFSVKFLHTKYEMPTDTRSTLRNGANSKKQTEKY